MWGLITNYDEIINSQITLNKIKSAIRRNNNVLADNPNPATKINLFELNEYYSNVLFNLNWSLVRQGIVSFNLHIFNCEDECIDPSIFDEIFHPIQKEIKLCGVSFENSENNSDNSSSDVVSTASDSLNVVVASKHKQNPENPRLRNALKLFNEIIDCEDDIDKLEKLKEKIGIGPIIQYMNLLNVLNDKKLNLKLYDEIKPLGFDTRVIDESLINKVLPVLDNYI